HIHSVGYGDSGTLEPITDFDYDAVDRALGFEPEPETPVEFADMTAAFSLVLQWIATPTEVRHVGARALTLLYFLDPSNSRFGSLEEIAKNAGCTRQAI